MTSPTSNTPQGPAAGRSTPFSGRTIAVLLLLLAAVAGLSAGVALDRVVLLPRALGHHPFGPGPDGRPPFGRGPRRDALRERFSRALDLSPAQRARIDSIMDRQVAELRGLRKEVQPRVDSALARARQQIDSVLTPEQRRRADTLRHLWGRDRRPGVPAR